MKRRAGPKEYFGDRVRIEIFEKVKPMWIARHLAISPQTVYAWRRNPGSMPVWRYFQILREMEVFTDWTK